MGEDLALLSYFHTLGSCFQEKVVLQTQKKKELHTHMKTYLHTYIPITMCALLYVYMHYMCIYMHRTCVSASRCCLEMPPQPSS